MWWACGKVRQSWPYVLSHVSIQAKYLFIFLKESVILDFLKRNKKIEKPHIM